MSRLDLLTILIVGICLAALGYLVYKTINIMNPPAPADVPSVQDSYDLGTTDSTDYDWYSGVDTTTTAVGEAGDPGMTTDPATDDNTATDTYEETTPTTPVTEEEPDDTPTTSPRTSSAGQYMVLAGSFRQKSNAESQVSRLRKMGYNNASVELFDNGAYAVALVDRFGDYSTANNLAAELKGKGVEAMVMRQN